MTLELRRIIVFAADLKSLAAFYRDVLGLPEKPTPDDPRTWLEFHAGASSIALHNGGSVMHFPCLWQPHRHKHGELCE